MTLFKAVEAAREAIKYFKSLWLLWKYRDVCEHTCCCGDDLRKSHCSMGGCISMKDYCIKGTLK